MRRALPTARVGGPDTAGHGGQFTRDFFEHALRGVNYATGRVGTPLDFVSFHAKGRPTFVDGHVRMGIANQLATIDEGFRMVASFPELKRTPIVIGESDPDGCAACQGSQLGYRNTTMYSSYTAAAFARTHDLADRHGVNLEGALTWAFEFEDQPYFAGFRVLATNGIAQPVLNVFRMFSRMGAERLAVTSDGAVPLDAIVKDGVRDRPDVAALASRDDRRADHPGLALPRRRCGGPGGGGLAVDRRADHEAGTVHDFSISVSTPTTAMPTRRGSAWARRRRRRQNSIRGSRRRPSCTAMQGPATIDVADCARDASIHPASAGSLAARRGVVRS